MRRLRILDAAVEEAAEAAAWYERRSPGLGVDFQHAVETALDLLEDDVVPCHLSPVRRHGMAPSVLFSNDSLTM
jgi:hypothetical protein